MVSLHCHRLIWDAFPSKTTMVRIFVHGMVNGGHSRGQGEPTHSIYHLSSNIPMFHKWLFLKLRGSEIVTESDSTRHAILLMEEILHHLACMKPYQ